jgi:hypothetical protein
LLPEDLFFKTLSSEELWKRYCGFLDLTVEEFMQIQRALLSEQLSLVADSALGRKILGSRPPRTIDEFRRAVPFTTYDDYEPYLSEKREDVLAAPPAVWCHSSGRGGRFKWVPHSRELMEKTVRDGVGLFNLTAATRHGEITIGPGMRMLVTVPLAPYTSGTIFAALRKRFTFQPIPPLESVGDLPFSEQVARAFAIALRDGFDVGGAIASVLVRMGQQMAGQAAGGTRPTAAMLHPKVLFRLLRAYLRSRAQNRPVYPKDLWNPRGIMAGGVDTRIYRDDIEKYWGVTPFDVYASTETMFLGMQSWTKTHMTLLPDSVFLEFLPHDPGAAEPGTDGRSGGRAAADTVLLDQLQPGQLYELVITQFHGMPLLRYRIGDVIRVVSAEDAEAGVRLPQIEMRRKVGEAINLGGLCNLDERTLWTALAATGLPYAEWTALKEYDHNETFLRVVIEMKQPRRAAEVSRLLDDQLRRIDTDYADVNRYLGLNPVRTTVLSEGTFARYTEHKVREGAVLSHFKPKHMNPSMDVLERLLSSGAVEDKES